MDIVEIRQIRKTYGKVVAVDNVSLRVEQPGIVAILGPNGAGKSSTLDMLLGLRRPQQGTVRVLGGSPADGRIRARIGAAPQQSGVPATLRVREIAAFVAAQYPNAANVETLLDAFGLTALARRQAGGLSGGELRRLTLALAFAGNPELAVLDEPTNGLDLESRRAVWAYLRAFAQAGGTVLLTTHHMEEAEALASRIVVMARGKIVRDGSPAELRAGQSSRIAFCVDAADAEAATHALSANNIGFVRQTLAGQSLEDAMVRILEETV